MRGNPKEVAFCYLYEDFPRMYPYERLDSETVNIKLPLPDGNECSCMFSYDQRDRRTLVVFDGDIPWCGLPRAGSQQAMLCADTLTGSLGQQRKPKEYELPAPYAVPEKGTVELTLMRRHLLLPVGNALIMRYRQHSLVGWYSMVKVFRHADDVVEVDFLTSDY